MFNNIEIINLKKIIDINITEYNKLINYADNSVDPQIKQLFNKGAQDCFNNKIKFISLLNK